MRSKDDAMQNRGNDLEVEFLAGMEHHNRKQVTSALFYELTRKRSNGIHRFCSSNGLI